MSDLRGQLAREVRRRCVKSAARLKVAKAEATSLADVDAALAAHAELLGPFARLFPVIKLPEIAALRELRRAMEEWVSLEGELVALLARDADEVYEQLAAAVLRAETAAAAGVKCTPAQQELYDRGRKVVDANASAAITPVAEEALWVLDRGKMEQAAGDAKKVGFDSEEVKKLNELLAMPEDKFVELQLKKAVELKDPVRVVNREIRLRGIYLQKHGAMFEPHKYPKLRSPNEWAGAKYFGMASAVRKVRDELAQGMLYFSKAPIHISLTELEPELSKEATQLFKCLLAYAGERPNPYPPAMAVQVLHAGVEKPDLRPEIYMQIIKQLRNNGSADSMKRYWELLALALMSFAPGTGCDDFVHVFCARHAEDKGQKFISLLHTAQYEGGQPLPAAAEIPSLLSGFFARAVRSRFSFIEEAGSVALPRTPSGSVASRGTPAASIDRGSTAELIMKGANPESRKVSIAGGTKPPPAPSVKAAEPPLPMKVVALHDCVAQSESGLSFKRGDTIVITERRDDGWWLGELGGKMGWAFNTFLKPAGN